MVKRKSTIEIQLDGEHSMADLLGYRDSLLKIIEDSCDVDIFVIGDIIEFMGEYYQIEEVDAVFKGLISQLNQGQTLSPQNVRYAIEMVKSRDRFKPGQSVDEPILVSKGKGIRAKTLGQRQYIKAMRDNTIVFAIGPAGTGKTYLAMAMAVNALNTRAVERLILVRPVVEAGEKLGFLPGDLYEKVDPYLRPLYDALYEMMGAEQFHRLLERGTIEVAPLAYMRGRTLNDSFIILDEAQNTSAEQMKMFLTRLGFGSKAVITGDVTQIDLPEGRTSGLKIIREILGDMEDVEFIYLDSRDVIRHQLVQRIVNAYGEYEERARAKNNREKEE
ncbi:phosphate starvation-inducible protein PhoH and related proteins [Candidatus Hakubella thermalkaliphila]|uniref:PhoH-like protein n=2 Tax=Candidatus Hakubella thermalkaliphila TaxID=2754717 RepID=A0A6V8P387_9ACTN|nr:PhoH family protein [Candidatus Hakubella thermalkaliphila]GFP27035.1 phosphate starvation-inducible protein PhoH and related proteins [Candidatus Hakubella thermalkaliphila]